MQVTKNISTEKAAFFLAVVVLMVPIWVTAVFATQDGPAHSYNAVLILELLRNPDVWYSSWISFNPRIDPTWAPHLLLAGLVAVVPVDLAEKLFQSMCLVLLPVTTRYLLDGVRKGSGPWAWLALPMSYRLTFHLGFYSFVLGLSASMVMLGYWLRQDTAWSIRTIAVQMLLATLAYFAHIFAFLAFGVAMVLPAIVRLATAWRAHGTAHMFNGHAIPWALAFAPAVLLAGEFLLARQSETYAVNLEWRIKSLAQFSALQSFTDIEAIPSIGLALLIFFVFCFALVRIWRDTEPESLAWLGSLAAQKAVNIRGLPKRLS